MLPALVVLVAVTIVHLVAQVTAPDGAAAELTQVLLMPVLAWVLITSVRTPLSRLVRIALLALGLSWLGDAVPRFLSEGSEPGFIVMLIAFLLAQLTYVVAFLPFASRSIARTAPLLLVPYLAVLVGLSAAVGWRLEVMVYGVAIVTMAVLATGLDRVAALGGIAFLVSDGLIALRAFAEVELPVHGMWVMLTYVIAQTLLIVSVAHHDRAATLTGSHAATRHPASRPSSTSGW